MLQIGSRLGKLIEQRTDAREIAAAVFGHHDAVLAGAGDAVGRRDGHAELRHVGAAGGLAAVVAGVGLGFNRVRQLAERQVDDLVLALVQHV